VIARLAAWLLVAAAGAAAAAVAVRDDAGRAVELAAPARRVVALAPHLAELVYAAGGGDRLVGVMRYTDYPPAAARLPVIGDAFTVNLEAVAALHPDLLLVWSSGVNPRQQQALHALDVAVYDSDTTTVEGIAQTLTRLGRLLGTEAVADAAARDTRARWTALHARYAARPPVRVFYQLWDDPLMTVSRGHLIDQAITACGGVNVFAAQAALTPTVSWEAAVAADPQIVVTGTSRDEPARLGGWERFARVDAVRRHQLVALDAEAMARMSPRFIDAAQRLCEAIDRARPGHDAIQTPPASRQSQP
jgi:iron complex transport system substrate-binding protein